MDITITLELVAFVVLMALSAFFSSSETSLFSLNRLQLEQMRQHRNPRVTLIQRLLSQPRHLIVTILIGNELVNVAASVISAAIVIKLLGPEAKLLNLVIMVPVLLLVGEITPKTLAIRNNVAFASFQCRFVDLFARAITPLRWIIRQISEFFITLIVGRERSPANIITEDMVRSLAQEAVVDGVLDSEEALYINRIFDFGDKVLRDVMTPRSQIDYLPATASPGEAADNYKRSGHTKVPVYKGGRDTVVGVLYARDLLDADIGSGAPTDDMATVSDVMRPAYFVPETKSVADLFYIFRKRKLSLALTVDEYGGITGLVTMENLLECIFGDILSRSELMRQGALNIVTLRENEYRVDGAMTVRQFNRWVGADLESETAETIGGLLLHAFSELPSEGRSIVVGGLEFTIVSVARQRIAEITVRPALAQDLLPGPAASLPGPSTPGPEDDPSSPLE